MSLKSTLQSLFNKIASALLRQGHGSGQVESGRPSCYYRRGTERCAVGFLIPDDHYNESFEGEGVTSLLKDHPELFEVIGLPAGASPEEKCRFVSFLASMQVAHDQVLVMQGMDDWKVRMRTIAQKYNIDPAVIDCHKETPHGTTA